MYASAYLKAHYPAAFYAALLNNQPMGFYHPATLVKDAQRHGVRFTPIDVQRSSWDCRVDEDGTVRLGLRYARGLREDVGRRIEGAGAAVADAAGGKRGDVPGAGAAPRAAWDDGVRGAAPRAAGGDGLHDGHVPRTAAMKDVTPAPSSCAKCANDDPSMIDRVPTASGTRWFCRVCAHDWEARGVRASGDGQRAAGLEGVTGTRFRSIEHLVAVTGARRDEVSVLAEIGALNGFGYDRRTALWQIERAVRPAGELFAGLDEDDEGAHGSRLPGARDVVWSDAEDVAASAASGATGGDADMPVFDPTRATSRPPASTTNGLPPAASASATGAAAHEVSRQGSDGHGNGRTRSPLPPMTPIERVAADYVGTGLTIGPHPMSLRRRELALRGVLRASDLPVARAGRRVLIAGAVITRQRPGTAKGFVFLTLEDETGISNVIVRPDVFDDQRRIIISEPFVIVEGILQQQEGVTSVNADRVVALGGGGVEIASHDFH